MITFMESKDSEKCLGSKLWHACAGNMVQMPPLNSRVFYFPQGHAEHAYNGKIDFSNCPKLPAFVSCRVLSVKFMADLESDEVFAKIRLIPVNGNEIDDVDNEGLFGGNKVGNQEKEVSFAKTLTRSDANNGGGFSVPRDCAENIFPRLDYAANPPVQTILAQDVHGETWRFRHIYRGTPRRHLLTTGWSTFVNQKKLVAGDSVVFLRAENGDLCVGIRRAKRGGLGGGSQSQSMWTPYGGLSSLMKNSDNVSGVRFFNGLGLVKPESVIEAATCAANGQPFEVVYYPRANTPEFCVNSTVLNASMQVRWCSGMRFKMAFETEDSSRISWFMGTISCVQVSDPILWPDSPWRSLQVTWDEPDLLQNVKRVSPWLVEFVLNKPAIHLSAFSPPLKKMRPQQEQQHLELSVEDQLHFPCFSMNNFLCPIGFVANNNTPAGIQGVRHASYHKLQSNTISGANKQSKHSDIPITNKPRNDEIFSCLLTMGSHSQTSKKFVKKKPPQFVLFGQTILIEHQTSYDENSSLDENMENNTPYHFDPLESGHRKV